MRPDGTDWADLCQAVGPCVRPGEILLTERALSFCNLPRGSFVADVGCGAGGSLRHIETAGLYRFAGLDPSQKLLEEAFPRLDPGHLVRAAAEWSPFRNGSCDALLCECVLSVVSDRMAALREFSRTIKDGGFLIMSDVFRENDPTKDTEPPSQNDRLASGLMLKDDLHGALERGGFTILLWEEHKRLLKEFLARMILSDACPGSEWLMLQDKGAAGSAGRTSYFLLVARKKEDVHG
jgi:arsenite methyltransferase